MGQFSKVRLVIYNVHTVPQRARDGTQGLGVFELGLWAQPSHYFCLEYL